MVCRGPLIGPSLFRPFWNSALIRKPSGAYVGLFPAVRKDWSILPKAGTFGGVGAALKSIELMLGRTPFLRLHSFRSFIPTCAAQLQFDLEKRRKLGRWSATSMMPELYDRATCASELATRSKVLDSLAEGWRPAKEFEIPETFGVAGRLGTNVDSDSVASESSSGTASQSEVDISKLYE